MKPAADLQAELARIPAVSPAPISGDAVARKLQAVFDLRDSECAEELEGFPWLRAAMWFLQWQSQQPGGLGQWWRTTLLRHPECVGSAAIRQLLAAPPSLDTAVRVWLALPRQARAGLGLSPAAAMALRTLADGGPSPSIPEICREVVVKATGLAAWRQCAAAAMRFIPEHLANACQTPGRPFFLGDDTLANWGCDEIFDLIGNGNSPSVLGTTPENLTGDWLLGDLPGLLQLAMADQAKAAQSAIAPTSVSRLLFGELDFAQRERRPVVIHGSARHGKTESLGAWVAARPGTARLITVPPGQRERDMLVAMADALGISHTPTTSPLQLGAQVAYVVKWGRLFLVFDEAHNLWPAATSRHAVPKRLNFVRDLVLDKARCGCAFVATRQSYHRSREDFLQRTGYAIEQWDGRVGSPLALPEELPNEDLAAVGRHLCPEIGKLELQLLVSLAVASEGYLGRLDRFLHRARFLAREQGRSAPNLQDIEAAVLRETGQTVQDILAPEATRGPGPGVAPSPKRPATGRRGLTPAPALPARGTVPAMPLQTA